MDGTWERINRALRERLRVRLKRDPQPSAGVVDSQGRSRVPRWARGAPPKARSRSGAWGVGQGVDQRGRGHRLAETIASQRLRGVAEEVGSGADYSLDREEQEDE